MQKAINALLEKARELISKKSPTLLEVKDSIKLLGYVERLKRPLTPCGSCNGFPPKDENYMHHSH